MSKIKFFVITLMLLISCLSVNAMENTNKITEKSNEINYKVEDKNKIENIIKYVKKIEKKSVKNVNFDEVDVVIRNLDIYIDEIKKYLGYGENENNYWLLINRISNLMLALLKESLVKINAKIKNVKNIKTDKIRTYITKTIIYQKYLTELKQKIVNEEIKNRINGLLNECCNITIFLIKTDMCVIEKENKKNTYLIYYLYDYKDYLEKINNIENKEKIFGEQIKEQSSKLNESILDIQNKMLEKYYEKVNRKTEILERTINKNKSFRNKSFENMRDTVFYLKEDISTLKTILKNTIENSSRDKFSFLLNRIFNLIFEIFEICIVKVKTEKCEDKEIDKIEEDIIYVKLSQKDLIELKKQTDNKEIEEKINKLINEFFDINLNLIKIYCFKAKTNSQNDECLTLLSLLYNWKSYIEEFSKVIEEIDENKDIKYKEKIDITKKEILNAQYEILKKHYMKYILEYIEDNKNNTFMLREWVEFNLDYLNKLKKDCISLFKDEDFNNVNCLIDTLTKMKNL